MGNVLATVISVAAVTAVRELFRLFSDRPANQNDTNEELEQHYQRARKAEAEAKKMMEEAKRKVEESKQREEAASMREQEANQREQEANHREAEARRREQVANLAAEQARIAASQASQRDQALMERQEAAKRQEEEATRLAGATKQAALEAQKCEEEANFREKEARRREEEANKAASKAREQERKTKKNLERANVHLFKGIQPEVWPTEKQFRSAQTQIRETSFRHLWKLRIGCNRTGAGTLNVPGWQYFNEQGLFVFDIIILVYDARFTEIDVAIIQHCERYHIPLFLVRSKADIQIKNILRDQFGYDEGEENAVEKYKRYHPAARQLLINSTRKNLTEIFEKANLADREVFIVSNSSMHSLVTEKWNWRTVANVIDEANLLQAVLEAAHTRRYAAQASAKDHSTVVKRNMDVSQSSTSALSL